MTTAHD